MESSVATFTVLYREAYIIDVQHPTILLWKPCITSNLKVFLSQAVHQYQTCIL